MISIFSKNDFDYIGIELGADAQADVNLDDFMVFNNDRQKAEVFFADLIRKHIALVYEGNDIDIESNKRFISQAFTQHSPFLELTKAAEGVPRDAINIASLAAQKADEKKISASHVRIASKTWYDRDKSKSITGKERNLLMWIVDKVIGEKRAKSFLLAHDKYAQDDLIKRLVDARVLHILKRGYSAQDVPGVRFDVYGIDYGCYVDLFATTKAPNEDVIEEISGEVSVPEDDYRSIRRAILDLDEFYESIVS